MNNDEFLNKNIQKIISDKIKIENSINEFSKKKIYNDEFKNLSNKYSILNNVIYYFDKLNKIKKEIDSINNIINDFEIKKLVKEELFYLNNKKNDIENILKSFINDYYDNNIIYKGCFLEIRSGTGGIESSLFINDLYKMYVKYSYKKKWNIELISKILNQQGGYKEIILKIKNPLSYDYLKFESGGHRVQRIPETESQGRIHTSTCIIAVMPILPEKELKSINSSDLKIDTFKSSGAGGQHVNTTDSAIRITHVPTGLVVECQDERSQHKNKSKAISILQSRLYLIEKEKIKKEKYFLRKNLLGSGYRTDRIRTYNFIQNRITDHRILFNSYRLYDILNGNLDILINLILKEIKEIS